MALSEGDVLNALSAAAELGIDFYVENIHVSPETLTTVRDHIRAGNILIAGGTNPAGAVYDSDTDILWTPALVPPADEEDKALLVHECVHAMIDIYNTSHRAGRAMGELAAYLTQMTYLQRRIPNKTSNAPPGAVLFWPMLLKVVNDFDLGTAAGAGAHIPANRLEPMRLELMSVGTSYRYSAKMKAQSSGLSRQNPFLEMSPEPIYTRTTSVSYEALPDPGDGYLIDVLNEKYSTSNVKGYGDRLRRLRRDFLYCSKPRAIALRARLLTRIPTDKLSEAFYERLSHGGRAILLKILTMRS